MKLDYPHNTKTLDRITPISAVLGRSCKRRPTFPFG